jgi:protein-tyrosine phosphatase
MIAAVLVVCTGNICRSPAGERMLARLCPDLRVGSAGLGALVGQPADPTTADVAARHFGLDLSGHVARQFAPDLGLSHDLILVMEPHHRSAIQRSWPHLSGKVMLFDQWTGAKGVEDPFRRAPEVHARVLTDIDRAAQAWAPRLTPRKPA